MKSLIFPLCLKNIIVKERIRKGIPESYRGKMWPILANVDGMKAKSDLQFEVREYSLVCGIHEDTIICDSDELD